ncbi:MAG: hypothetical protein ACTSP1_16340, partial [Candidatus Freyarchaeota archaeon]
GALHRRREPPAGARPAGAVTSPEGNRTVPAPAERRRRHQPHHTRSPAPHETPPRTRGHGRTKATKANQKPKKQELWDNLLLGENLI